MRHAYSRTGLSTLFVSIFTFHINNISKTLLAIVDKYGIPISQWAWLCQALLEVSMNKIALWINVCADDWTAEMSTIASNVTLYICRFGRIFQIAYCENKAYIIYALICSDMLILWLFAVLEVSTWIQYSPWPLLLSVKCDQGIWWVPWWSVS